MFLLQLIPDWITYLLSGMSFLGLVLGVLLPIPAHYKMALYSGLGMLLCLNSFAIGVSVNEASWQVKVKEMQIQIAQLETKTAEVTTKVVTEYVEKVKIVKEKTHEFKATQRFTSRFPSIKTHIIQMEPLWQVSEIAC